MKAITNTGINQLAWLELPLPFPQPGQVRIRTGACGICATDLHMIAGWSRTSFPSIPGHEWAGVIDAVGVNVDPSLVGKHCVGENVLTDGGEIGFEHPGGYGEYFITEAKNLHIIPGDMPFSIATLMEPLAVSVRGIRKLRISGRDKALIFGDGPIGFLVLMLLNRIGVKTICMVGGRSQHLKIAANLGVEYTINYHDAGPNLGELIRAASTAFPIVIEASGSKTAIQASLELVGRCGQILVLGDYGSARASFEWNHLLHQEIVVVGSNASADAWPEAVQLAVSESLPLESLVTHHLPAQRYEDGIELTRSRRGDVIKVVLDWI